MKEKITIVMPIYNTQNYLEKSIYSLIRQSYKNIEIILVNDGSTDESLKLCYEIQKRDERIRVISKENGGVSSARNVGLENATGGWIMFLDSDDMAAENWCEELHSLAQLYPTDMIICNIQKVDSRDGHCILNRSEIIRDERLQCGDFFSVLMMEVLNQPVNKIYNVSILKEHGIVFNEKFDIGEDLDFNLQYLKYCQGITLCSKKLYYCVDNRENSLCHSFHENYLRIQVYLYKKMKCMILKYREELSSDFYTEYLNVHIDTILRIVDKSCKLPKRKKILLIKEVLNSDTLMESVAGCREEAKKGLFMKLVRKKNPYILYEYINKICLKN